MEKIAYIDGDILPYRVGFATQRTIYTISTQGYISGPVLVTPSKRVVNKLMSENPDLIVETHEHLEEDIAAINTLKLSIQGIVKGSGCQRFKVILSGDTNFRERIATIQKYKGNRDGKDKPHHWQMLRDWLADMPYTIITDDEEADDVLSRAMLDGNVGCTIDKDLNNTAGVHYNFQTKDRYTVSEEEALRNFYKQCLTGDTADNIPGIRGIGPKKSDKLLAQCTTPSQYEELILAEYAKVYDNPCEALTEVGRLLWMRREENEMWNLDPVTLTTYGCAS